MIKTRNYVYAMLAVKETSMVFVLKLHLNRIINNWINGITIFHPLLNHFLNILLNHKTTTKTHEYNAHKTVCLINLINVNVMLVITLI